MTWLQVNVSKIIAIGSQVSKILYGIFTGEFWAVISEWVT